MRIWLLTSELPQEFAGGIARYVENFARLLGETGHEVVVIARTEQACDTWPTPGVRLIGVSPRYARLDHANPGGLPDTHPGYPYNILAYWPALSYQMAEEVLRLLQQLPPPDLIESQEYAALPYYLLLRKLTERTALERIPVLVHLHSPVFELARFNQEPRYRFPQYWVGQMEKFCLVAADALLSPSSFLADWITQSLQRSLDVTRIPYPLVLPNDLLPGPLQPRRLVSVGRLELRKGVLPLVKACSQLWAAGVDFHLTLIGGDVAFYPKETTVGTFIRQRYAKWVESGHLELAGQLEWNKVFAYLQQAWAVVIPSLWENFPNTCMEAMGIGQVVLASRGGGQAEMIETHGVEGFLFDWNQPGDFAQQLQTVLALSEDERRQIGRRAQARIRRLCDPGVVLSQRLRHYEAVIEHSTPRRLFPTVNSPFADHSTDTQLQPASYAVAENDEQPGLLSVVIPYYNLGDYLWETLESVLRSTYTPYEVLIVDDGSTETKSITILQEIAARRLAHVRIIPHVNNQGLPSARNTGAEAARGEFIAFLDSDDAVEPDFFTRAIDILDRYSNVSFVYSWVRYFGESKEIWPTWNVEFPYLLGHNMLAPLVVMRRPAFLRWARNKSEFEYNFEDFESWIALLEAGGIGVSLPHLLVRYRVRSGSMYRSANRNQQIYLYDLLTQRHEQAYRNWGVELFNLQNANGPGHLWNHPAIVAGEPHPSYLAALEGEKRNLMTRVESQQEYIRHLEQGREQLWAEVQHAGQAWGEQKDYIEQLEKERAQLWAEVQRAGQIWKEQKSYIENLEAQFNELIATEDGNNGLLRINANGIARSDYELGGRLVSKLRQTWFARQVLRYPRLKDTLRKALRG